MATAADQQWDASHELTHDEGWKLLDEQARRYLGLSAEEFIRAWDSGELDPNDPCGHSAVMGVAMLLPLIREVCPSS